MASISLFQKSLGLNIKVHTKHHGSKVMMRYDGGHLGFL